MAAIRKVALAGVSRRGSPNIFIISSSQHPATRVMWADQDRLSCRAAEDWAPAILEQLLQHNLDVTVPHPPREHGHLSCLRQGCSASTTAPRSLSSPPCRARMPSSRPSRRPPLIRQLLLIDAAVEAGVRRFIPSEFGSDSTNPKAAALPVFRSKIAAQKALAERAAASTSGFTYTLVITGPLLGWGLTQGLHEHQRQAAPACTTAATASSAQPRCPPSARPSAACWRSRPRRRTVWSRCTTRRRR